jgi:uncharacterized protein
VIGLPIDKISRLWPIASSIAVGAAGVVALAGEFGYRQITRAQRSLFEDDPSKWGLPAPEHLVLRAVDGVRLSAWFFEAPRPAPTVIVCHGHLGNKHTLLPFAQFLAPRYNVLLLDSRGHGESEGDRTTVGCAERLDVHAAVDEVLRRGRGPVGVFGISMGAAIAILAAAEDTRIAAVLADSPFARLRWAVAEVARVQGYPPVIAPAMAYVGCRTIARRFGYPMKAFDPIEAVASISPRPLLLIHGADDKLVSAENSRRIFERAGEPKELWILDGLGHCKGLDEVCDTYQRRVVSFFGRYLPQSTDGDVATPRSGDLSRSA